MITGFVAWILNNYLGKYLENLNTNQLSIGLLRGEVELENLPLKKDALRHLEVPLEIKGGFVGKIKLKIPLSRLRSEPWVIFVEQLYAVLGKVEQVDEDNEEKAELEKKLSSLDTLEAYWRTNHETRHSSSYYASSYLSWLGYGTSLITNIIENIQIKIRDVHIRYEDQLVGCPYPFAVGITVTSLTMQTCDGEWSPKFITTEHKDFSYKLIQLHNFGIYLKTRTNLCGNLPLQDLAVELIRQSEDNSAGLDFLMIPVSAEGRIKRNLSLLPLKSRNTPRLFCDIEIHQINLNLSQDQYRCIYHWAHEFNCFKRTHSHFDKRPTVPIVGGAVEWWKYAINAETSRIKKLNLCRTWESVLCRAKDIVRYVDIYLEHIRNPVTVDNDSRDFKEQVEVRLPFETLKTLREIAIERLEGKMKVKTVGGKEGGLLWSWFPYWSGWWNTSSNSDDILSASFEEEPLDEEFFVVLKDSMESNTLLKRDVVFAHLNFQLNEGRVQLLMASSDDDVRSPMLELEFKNVKVGFESRPKLGSTAIRLSLGAMYLHDKSSAGSLFPKIVSPISREYSDASRFKSSTFFKYFAMVITKPKGEKVENSCKDTLFDLLYEIKPLNSSFDYRLHIATQSLEVIYHPSLMKRMLQFFKVPLVGNLSRKRSQIMITELAKSKYEELKQQTKEEIKKNLDYILEGEQVTEDRWDLKIDLSAPQILIPESLKDKNALFVIIDFGNLHLYNANQELREETLEEEQEDSENESEFITPCSTPPSEGETFDSPLKEIVNPNYTSSCLTTVAESIIDAPEKYNLDLLELQVLVGRLKDNWKFAVAKGTSSLHILDRFNISIQAEKRVTTPTPNPLTPNLTINGNLKQLVVHMNEEKVQSIYHLITTVIDEYQTNEEIQPSPVFKSEEVIEVESITSVEQHSQMIALQFCIDHLSVELQSRSHNVGELQITGAKAQLTKHLDDFSVSLTVHGLLLVDALQTFGPDFELLAASHRSVCLDSLSGSLLDSEANSPTSPASPASPRDGTFTTQMPINHQYLHSQLSSHRHISTALSGHSVSPPSSLGYIPSQPSDFLDSDALITVKMEWINKNGSAQDKFCIVDFHFNNLDITANQETIVELVSFAKRVMPNDTLSKFFKTESCKDTDTPASDLDREERVTELNFNFNRLNILLLRAVTKDNSVFGRKIGTATMTGAKIQANLGKNREMKGSLGGLQILDLTPEGLKHQRILSVGHDSLVERTQTLVERLNSDLVRAYNGQISSESCQAFSFKINCENEENICVKLDMASVVYTHSPVFLSELQSCATEFKQYMKVVAQSITNAAKEVALGLVTRRRYSIGADHRGSSPNVTFGDSFYSEDSSGMDTWLKSECDSSEGSDNVIQSFMLHILIETPIIVLPCSPFSSRVLVAQLGQIEISNNDCDPTEINLDRDVMLRRPVLIEIRKISLYSLDVDDRVRGCDDRLMMGPMALTASELYSCVNLGKPILHDTSIEIIMKQTAGHAKDPFLYSEDKILSVTGRVIEPLKISVSKEQFALITNTLSNMTSGGGMDDVVIIHETLHSTSDYNTDSSILSAFNERLKKKLTKFRMKSYSDDENVGFVGSFSLPDLEVDLAEGDKPFVSCHLHCLDFKLKKLERFKTEVLLELKSLNLFDELVSSEHYADRFLMTSCGTDMRLGSDLHKTFLSRSCPDRQFADSLNMHNLSLPTRLDMVNPFEEYKRVEGKRFVPATGESSRRSSSAMPGSQVSNNRRLKSLVSVHMLFLDQTPEFVTKYGNTKKFVEIDFNSLDVLVNVNAWVMLLDFFDLGVGKENDASSISKNQSFDDSRHQSLSCQDSALSTLEVEIQVKSLNIVLNKPKYRFAKINISNFSCHIARNVDTVSLTGKLGDMSVIDLSPHGKLYPEKFRSSGDEAMDFQISRYRKIDPDLHRTYDMRVKIRMTSVFYTHSQRFIMELQAFFQDFGRIQHIVNSLKGSSSADKTDSGTERSSRILLNIHMAKPEIVIPMSYNVEDLLILDLGRLDISNSFHQSGSPATITGRKMKNQNLGAYHGSSGSPEVNCLLDVIEINMLNLEVYEGRVENKQDQKQSDCCGHRTNIVRTTNHSLLKDTCNINLQVERNLETSCSLSVPGLAMLAELSKIHLIVNPAQYSLIRAILSYNFGEPIDDLNFHPNNANEDPQNRPTDVVHTAIELGLENVTVDLVTETSERQNLPHILGRIYFINSVLLYEKLSGDKKEIDLVSKEIVLHDFRFEGEPMNKRSNIFSKVLSSHGWKSVEKKGQLQVEVHYRSAKGHSQTTIVLNNMRVYAILDWWQELWDYINNSRNDPLKEGIISKRAPVIPTTGSTYEFKLNVIDSEFILLEDTSISDTNAIILKCTAVITYMPLYSDKPLSCYLNDCEMFSCSLSSQSDTALTIIEPVIMNIELNKRYSNDKMLGILEVTDAGFHYCLEVGVSTHLAVRLSYKDALMFKGLMDSLPRQFRAVSRATPNKEEVLTRPVNFQADVNKLSSLGFSQQNCAEALQKCKGSLDEAALWLTNNATPCTEAERVPDADWSTTSHTNIEALEIRILSLSLCAIDDCLDVDVPLVELALNHVHFQQKLFPPYYGSSNFQCSVDYYNRSFSGWEPLVENFSSKLSWTHQNYGEVKLSVEAEDCVDINITSALLSLYKSVKTSWTNDYMNWCSGLMQVGDGRVIDRTLKKRSPFVPYAIKNETGCTLHFSTHTNTPTCIGQEVKKKTSSDKWHPVGIDETVEFTFCEETKSRSVYTHELRIHQMVVKVDGWCPTEAVSVDKVGTYFRHAKPIRMGMGPLASEMPPARIVFDVSLEGSARKLITIRSALLLINKLDEIMEVKLENPAIRLGDTYICKLYPGTTFAVPLPFISAQIYVRPFIKATELYYFCDQSITWKEVAKNGETASDHKVCQPLMSKQNSPFRFCLLKERNNYPLDKIPLASSSHLLMATPHYWVQPAHTITLLSPITVVNLLPSDLNFIVVGTDINVRMKPGKQCNLNNIDTGMKSGFKFRTENFEQRGEMCVSRDTCCDKVVIKLFDITNRKLELYVQLLLKKGGNMKVILTAPFWIINKTGLPLVVRQEGDSDESAGQFEENEIARSVVPLMFSPTDSDVNSSVVIRIGKLLHPESSPQWSRRFHLHKGAYVRQLKVIQPKNRPPLVYNIGIDIKKGVGRYRECGMITLWPRFQIENRTEFKIEVAQKYFTTKEQEDSDVRNAIMSVLPKSFTPFHWPRIDQDQIICVRIQDIPSCMWSGGFSLENINSFHINVRYDGTKNQFLRVDISLCSSTFHIAIMDAYTMPPPFRIDNFSEVPIIYYQTDVKNKNLRSIVRPHVSVPYAWDDPLLPPHLTCEAPGGSSAMYKLDTCGEGDNLTYESFIYINLTQTFPDCDTGIGTSILDSEKYLELVLDVSSGGNLIFKRKEPGDRSQLWRMTSEGFLQHEGSCPPSDPRKSIQHKSKNVMVLDVSDSNIPSTPYYKLQLRKPDPSRLLTQTWKFNDSGKLSCQHRDMFVQAKDGYLGLRSGIEAVLGPINEENLDEERKTHFTSSYSISRHKCRPGSGFLTVRVITDGPTRVLQIKDKRNSRACYRSAGGEDAPRPISNWVVMTEERSIIASKDDQVSSGSSLRQGPSQTWNFQLQLRLRGGVGISLVNSHPSEELLYARFSNINLEVIHDQQRLSVNGNVEKLQIDNQILNGRCGNVLYVTPSPKSDHARHLPALNFKVVKQHSMYSNADIYKYFLITSKNLTLIIEEELLLKLFLFWGWVQSDLEMERQESLGGESNYALQVLTSNYAKRYYFGDLRIILEQVRLSVLTKSQLSPELLAVKRQIGLTLIQFEDAQIELDPFVKIHPFETADFLLASVMKHYRDKLLSQAHKILTASDILGNPLGFITDLMEGFSGLISDGDVGGLVKNVTHGMANSALKVTVSLSDVMGKVTLDETHESERLRIRTYHSRGFGDYFMAGLKGFRLGVVGGITSIVTQTSSGASSDGLQGFIVGLGRGLVGTVTKPAVGVLDLAAGMASAVRDTSRSSTHLSPGRCRPTRVVSGPGGLLPKYSHAEAIGQEFLFNMRNRTSEEIFIAREQLSKSADNLRALISSEKVRILSSSSSSQNPSFVLEVDYNELHQCSYVKDGSCHLLELTLDSNPRSHGKRPKVKCDNEETARRVVRLIQYAKNLHDELLHTLEISGPGPEED